MIRFSTFCTKTHFPEKPKKLTQSIVRIGDVSLVQNFIKHPQRAREVSEENSCKIFPLKVSNKPPLAHVPFRGFFGLMGEKKSLARLMRERERENERERVLLRIERENDR